MRWWVCVSLSPTQMFPCGNCARSIVCGFGWVACCFAPQVSKYGKVESVRVEVVAGAVKVYVTCVTEEDVAAAIKQLHRRYFGGRVISARAVPM